ncbi:hypothetical protein EET67_04125 [Pseudaminobacter arsenicus]|uniref:Lipoprotein n=2 Tax=Borborobacter arsenicus TaxID=1851146 RepID=A0A432V9K1_9HYPH|nr:hypothetical protein [Pseudaminobacter arsenicus]RUM98840.1 hypothetical protein EET67_04125 [Pseudaminobacter arsenicus]
MMPRIWPVVALAALVAGCTTMTPEERRAADEAKCRSYGFTKRNDAFAECLQRLDLDRRADLRYRADFNSWYGPSIYRPVPLYLLRP